MLTPLGGAGRFILAGPICNYVLVTVMEGLGRAVKPRGPRAAGQSGCCQSWAGVGLREIELNKGVCASPQLKVCLGKQVGEMSGAAVTVIHFLTFLLPAGEGGSIRAGNAGSKPAPFISLLQTPPASSYWALQR